MILSVDARNAALKGIADKLNVGTNSVLSLYVGAVLAAEFALTNPVQASIAGAVMTFSVPQKVLAIASGTITAAKVLDASGTLIADIDIDTELELENNKVYSGGYVNLLSFTMGV